MSDPSDLNELESAAVRILKELKAEIVPSDGHREGGLFPRGVNYFKATVTAGNASVHVEISSSSSPSGKSSTGQSDCGSGVTIDVHIQPEGPGHP